MTKQELFNKLDKTIKNEANNDLVNLLSKYISKLNKLTMQNKLKKDSFSYIYRKVVINIIVGLHSELGVFEPLKEDIIK